MLAETPGEIADLQQQQSDLIYGPKQLTGGQGMLDSQIDRWTPHVFFVVWTSNPSVLLCLVLFKKHVINHPCFFFGGGLLVDVFG